MISFCDIHQAITDSTRHAPIMSVAMDFLGLILDAICWLFGCSRQNEVERKAGLTECPVSLALTCAHGQSPKSLTIAQPTEDFLYDQPRYMDPLVARTWANLTTSPLLRLPDELLIPIMKHVKFHDLLRLRMVSRQFLYLFSSPSFRWAHERPWVRDVWMPADSERRERYKFRMETLKHMYCQKCLAIRNSAWRGARTPELRFVHCSGCGSDHHARLFSAAQLRAKPSERICIGREGKLSLCEHFSLSYEQLQSHLEGWDGTPNTEILSCHHPCHDMSKDELSLIRRDEPAAWFVKSNMARKNVPCLRLISTSHFKLGNGSARPSAQAFRRGLHALQDQSPSPWYPLHHPQVTPLRGVDPNCCSCLTYDGIGDLYYPLKKLPSNQVAKNGPPTLWSRPGVPSQAVSKCFKYSHGFTEGFHSSQTRLTATLRNCLRHDDDQACVRLTLNRYLAITEPWKPEWRFALDKRSYGALAFKHRIWCDNEECENHLDRRLEEFIYPRFDSLEEQVAKSNRPCDGRCDLKRATADGPTRNGKKKKKELKIAG